MPNSPTFSQNAGIVHSGDPFTIIDYPSYVSVVEWGNTYVPGTSNPQLSYPPLGTGVAQPYGTTTTDDSLAINAALLMLGQAGRGQALYFPAGIYLVSTNAIVNTYNVPIQLAPGAIFTGTYAATLQNQGQPFWVRAVMTTVATSTTYTGTGTNTITFGSNAAIGTQDGISTLAVGDAVFLQGGTLGSCAITAADTGPWIISSLGSGTTKVVLKRPSWWLTGLTPKLMQQIDVGPEGSLFKGTRWTTWAATTIGSPTVVGTTDPLFYPDRVQFLVTLAASAFAVVTVPFRTFAGTTTNPLGDTAILCSLQAVGGTTTSTVGYGPIAAGTSGYVGTSTVTIVAQASGMTKNGTADTSVVSVLVVNRAA